MYTPNNPTGYHRLDLSDPAQRDLCLRLLELRNAMLPRLQQLAEHYAAGRSGGRREDHTVDPDLERVWRNATVLPCSMHRSPFPCSLLAFPFPRSLLASPFPRSLEASPLF